MNTAVSPCHLLNPNSDTKRKVTEEWLEEVVRSQNLKFRYFITLSFSKGQTSSIIQYLDNKHIKKVILDFFYPNKKPSNRIKIWFFVERHLTGALHLHLLMEGIDGLSWMTENNRKVSLSKRTLISFHGTYMDDVMQHYSPQSVRNWVCDMRHWKHPSGSR